MTPDEADRLKARLADVRATVEAHVPEWRGGAVPATAPPDGTVAEAAVIAPTALAGPCPFCEIVAGRAPATIVHRWTNRQGGAVIIVPLNPVTDGHVIVIPEPHFTDAGDDPWITGETARRAAAWAAGKHRAYNLITSVGAPATQTVMHLHWHVVPRAKGDGLHLPWTGQR